MCACTKNSTPSTAIGCSIAVRTRATSMAAVSSPAASSPMMTNSSLPVRATVASAPAAAVSRSATAAEYRVAGVVSVRVVHEREVVEVEGNDDDRAAVGAGSHAQIIEALAEQQPVRETGERVVETGVGTRFLGPLRVGDVSNDALYGEQGAGGIVDEREAVAHPDQRAVGPADRDVDRLRVNPVADRDLGAPATRRTKGARRPSSDRRTAPRGCSPRSSWMRG